MTVLVALLAFIDTPARTRSGSSRARARSIERLRGSDPRRPLADQLIRRGLEKLEQEFNDAVFVAPENLPNEMMSTVAISLVPLAELTRRPEPAAV